MLFVFFMIYYLFSSQLYTGGFDVRSIKNIEQESERKIGNEDCEYLYIHFYICKYAQNRLHKKRCLRIRRKRKEKPRTVV